MCCEWSDGAYEEYVDEHVLPPERFWLPRSFDRSRFEPEWYAKWAPRCPDGNTQRMCEVVGFRLKAPDHLQLRVILRDGDNGVCQLVVEEQDDVVFVHAVACLRPDAQKGSASKRRRSDRRETDCPCNWWLDAPLGERVVVNYENDEPLPLYIPHWDSDEPSEFVPRPPGDLWTPSD